MTLTELHWLALSIAFTGLVVGISLLVSTLKLVPAINKVMSITVTTQAPTALIPEHVTDLLKQVEMKLAPPKNAMHDQLLGDLVEQGFLLAEQAQKGVKGPDKFRIAREYVRKRAEEMQLLLDERALALRIEAFVAAHRVLKK